MKRTNCPDNVIIKKFSVDKNLKFYLMHIRYMVFYSNQEKIFSFEFYYLFQWILGDIGWFL